MRPSNSFSEGEIDLLNQIMVGLIGGKRDLAYLVRHGSFTSLAQKAKAMKQRADGSPPKPRRERLRVQQDYPEIVQAVLANPGASSSEIAAAVGSGSKGTIWKLGVLVARGAIEKQGASSTTRYWPVNASTVQPPLRLVGR